MFFVPLLPNFGSREMVGEISSQEGFVRVFCFGWVTFCSSFERVAGFEVVAARSAIDESAAYECDCSDGP